jgi:hypothetical protein
VPDVFSIAPAIVRNSSATIRFSRAATDRTCRFLDSEIRKAAIAWRRVQCLVGIARDDVDQLSSSGRHVRVSASSFRARMLHPGLARGSSRANR